MTDLDEVIVTAPRISANDDNGQYQWVLPTFQVRQLLAFLEACGINPLEVGAVTYDVIDEPLIHAETFVRDADGEWAFNAAGDSIEVTVIDYPVRVPLPAWWQPSTMEITK